MASSDETALVHLSAGIGNIVLATPLLIALHRSGCVIDLRVDGDYPDTAELFSGWSAIRSIYSGVVGPGCDHYKWLIPAIPPFYWSRYAGYYRGMPNAVHRPPDFRFYQDEQDYYLEFARAAGCSIEPRPVYFLPVSPDDTLGVTSETLVLAPGCKTGEMAAKRWPHYSALAERFTDVAVVGTEDDLRRADGDRIDFPRHVRLLAGQLSLRRTAAALAAAGVVVANDSGLGHAAAALGAPTILLFGPTPVATLGRFPPNVTVLRPDLACAPCWFGARFAACGRRIECLNRLSPARVAAAVRAAGCRS